MSTPRERIADEYENNDNRTPSELIMIGPDSGVGWLALSGAIDIEYRFDIGKVPQGTIHISNIGAIDILTFVQFFKNIIIYEGFGVDQIPTFTGRILDINDDYKGVEITFQGTSWPLDVAFHKIIYAFDDVENNQALRDLFGQAGITAFSVNLPTWQIGTVAPQVLEFATYGEAIQHTADPSRGGWWEMPDGIIKLRDIYVNDKFNTDAGAARTYWRPRNVGPTEVNPPGISSGRPRLVRWSRERHVRETKNRCFVTGCQVTQVNDDGSTDNINIGGEAQAASSYILNPDGSQAYNDEPFSSELIDEDAKADEVAGLIVDFENGMHEHWSVTVRGDPLITLMMNVRVIDYQRGVDRYMIVTGYTTHKGGGQYSTSYEGLFIDSSDSALIFPNALFRHFTLNEVMGDGLKAIVFIDATDSIDIDGTIENFEIVDNQTPHIINQSGASPYAAGLYTPADITPPLQISVTVTDNDGLDDELTLTIPYSGSSSTLVQPNQWIADETFASISLDGAQTWDDQALAGNIISVSAIPPISSFVLGSAGAMFGSRNGDVYLVIAGVATLELSGLGSPIVHCWYDLLDLDVAWFVTEDGRLYRNNSLGQSGFNWFLWDDLRVVFGASSAYKASRIATPIAGGVWVYGGLGGGPLVAIDFDKGHHWHAAALGGELAAAFP